MLVAFALQRKADAYKQVLTIRLQLKVSKQSARLSTMEINNLSNKSEQDELEASRT